MSLSTSKNTIDISGKYCEKVRELIVQIIRQHKLNNNLTTNIVSTQKPKESIKFDKYTVNVFEISKPKIDDASVSGMFKFAKRKITTSSIVELFPERVIGALVDLYILLFALMKLDIPDPNKSLVNDVEDFLTFNDRQKVDLKDLPSQWFYDLLRKKKETKKEYQQMFHDLPNSNVGWRKTSHEDQKYAKIFILAQIAYINQVKLTIMGGTRKTRRKKTGSRRRSKQKSRHNKRNTRSNKRKTRSKRN